MTKTILPRTRQAPERYAYHNMVHRCYCPTFKQYRDYGGRGIRVHEDWLGPGGFDRFLAYIGPKPTAEHVLARPNANGNYEPGNVGWYTRGEAVKFRRPFNLERRPSFHREPGKANKTGHPGVHFLSGKNKWEARIGHNRTGYHLGYHDTMEEAIAARRRAEANLLAGLPPI